MTNLFKDGLILSWMKVTKISAEVLFFTLAGIHLVQTTHRRSSTDGIPQRPLSGWDLKRMGPIRHIGRSWWFWRVYLRKKRPQVKDSICRITKECKLKFINIEGSQSSFDANVCYTFSRSRLMWSLWDRPKVNYDNNRWFYLVVVLVNGP